MNRSFVAVVLVSVLAACSGPRVPEKPPETKTAPPPVAVSGTSPVATAPGPSGTLDLAAVPKAPEGFATAQALQEAWEGGRVALVDTEAERPSGVVEYTELDYGAPDSAGRLLDLAAPAPTKEAAPVVLIAPPGCWSGADQRVLYRSWRYDLAAMGYVAAVADYAAPGPTKTAENLVAAVRWLRTNASRYGGDPNRIVLMGFGDGAYASLLAAYTARAEDRPRAVIDFYGATDPGDACWQGHAALQAFLGNASGEAVSPVKSVTKDAPPTLIVHGVLDTAFPVGESDRLASALQAAGAAFYYDRIEGWGRGFELQTELRARARQVIAAFLGQYVAAK